MAFQPECCPRCGLPYTRANDETEDGCCSSCSSRKTADPGDREHLNLPWYLDQDGMICGGSIEVIAGLAEDEDGKLVPAVYREDVREFIILACNTFHARHARLGKVEAKNEQLKTALHDILEDACGKCDPPERGPCGEFGCGVQFIHNVARKALETDPEIP